MWLQYSPYGDLVRETDPANGTDYRVVIGVDAAGNPINETYAGGNLTATRVYSPQTGQLQSVQYGSVANSNLRRLDYRYDVFGNLARQSLNTNQSLEDYTYDALQRLTQASRTGAATGTVDYTYDAIGNITSKSDFSTTAANAYSYTGGSCGGGPNAVKSVALQAGGTRTYCYDANGNMTADSAGTVLRYDHTQRPLQITRGGVSSTFDYDVDGSRFRQVGSDNVQYFPTLERRTGKDTVYAGSVAIVSTTSGTRRVDYQLMDRLGSVDAIADSSGNLIETRGYDAFGKPRSGTWGDATRLASTSTTPHGFTGHEHLNQLELIHMNGRVYDYSLGRFTGVDPLIQSPLNSQSLNPYSYILNNPLSGTDPTGYECQAMTGSHICGVDTGAQGGVTSQTFTVNTQDGNKVKISESYQSGGGRSVSVRVNGADVGAGPSGVGSRQEQAAPAAAKGTSLGGGNANGAVTGTICVSGGGGGGCGSGVRKTDDERQAEVLERIRNKPFNREMRLTPEAERSAIEIAAAMAQGKREGDSSFYLAADGKIVPAVAIASENGCATLRLPSAPAAAIDHPHLADPINPQNTLARELPGPEDLGALVDHGLVQVIVTPSRAVRAVEVIQQKNGSFEPRLRTLAPGDTFGRSRDLQAIGRWRQNWTGTKNYEVMKDL